MNVEYHKWWSVSLDQEMELKVYGHFGKPVIVFPTQSGRFYQFEDFGMVDAVRRFIDSGTIKLFTVDGVDDQSWCCWDTQPKQRAKRHEEYDHYIVDEVIPFARNHCGNSEQKFLATGCSMGGYHAPNFLFRHPDIFDSVISLSGMFQLKWYIGDYMDDLVYFNTPLYYLPNLADPWYLDRIRQSQIILCCGQGRWEEISISDIRKMEQVLTQKGIPAWIDIWGWDVDHDWPWWRKELPYFIEHLRL